MRAASTHNVVIGVLDCSDCEHPHEGNEGGVEGNRGHTGNKLDRERQREVEDWLGSIRHARTRTHLDDE